MNFFGFDVTHIGFSWLRSQSKNYEGSILRNYSIMHLARNNCDWSSQIDRLNNCSKIRFLMPNKLHKFLNLRNLIELFKLHITDQSSRPVCLRKKRSRFIGYLLLLRLR